MEVSANAAALIGDHVRKKGERNGGFRIQRGQDAEQIGELKIGYAPAPMPGDTVVASGEARVFVADDAVSSVDPFVLDARKVGREYRLFLH